MEKILSIGIAAYNMENYLHKCIDSLLIPSLDKLEIIIVNNASTDLTPVIAHEYETKYPCSIKVIDIDVNGHWGKANNHFFEIATGKYLKLLDADDSFNREVLEDYVKFLSTIDVDMILTPFIYVDENDKESTVVKYKLPADRVLEFEECANAWKKKALQMHATTYRTRIIKDMNFKLTEGIPYVDQEFIFTPLLKVSKIVYYNKILYRYLFGRVGQTMDENVRKRTLHMNELCVKRIINDYLYG